MLLCRWQFLARLIQSSLSVRVLGRLTNNTSGETDRHDARSAYMCVVPALKRV